MSRLVSKHLENHISRLPIIAILLFASTNARAHGTEGVLAAGSQDDAAVSETLILDLSVHDPAFEEVFELRQSIETGERLRVPLANGSTLTIDAVATEKKGQLRVGLVYEAARTQGEAPPKTASTRRDCELPGEIRWSPMKGGPVVHLSVRARPKIKLVLDGDPLA